MKQGRNKSFKLEKHWCENLCKAAGGLWGEKGKEERCLHATSRISLFTHLFIFIIKFHVGKFWIQESGKTMQKKKSLYFDSLLSKKKPLLSCSFQKRLPHNEKQEIKSSGQHSRSTNEKILQWHNASAWSADQVFIPSRCSQIHQVPPSKASVPAWTRTNAGLL